MDRILSLGAGNHIQLSNGIALAIFPYDSDVPGLRFSYCPEPPVYNDIETVADI